MINKQIKIGAILAYIQMAVSIVVGIVYTPQMIRMLGQNEYGLYSSVSSTISLFSVLSLGFSSGYLYYFARYKKTDDFDSIYKLNGLFIIIFGIIGLISFGLGLFLTFNLNLVFSAGFTPQEYEIAKVLMLILTINVSLSFPLSVFSTIICANERFIFNKIAEMGRTILTPIITLIILFSGFKSIGMAIVVLSVSLLVDCFNICYVFGKLKQKFRFKGLSFGLFKSLFVYTIFIAVNIVVRQVNWNLDKVLLGRFLGTGVVAIYALAASLHTYFETFSSSISGVLRTRAHNVVLDSNCTIDGREEKITTFFTNVGKVQFIILSLIFTGFILCGYEFITRFWANINFKESYIVAIILFLASFINLIQSVGIDIQRALNKHKFRSIVYLAMCVFNVALTVVLIKPLGATGAALATAATTIIADGIIMNIYYKKRCFINIRFFWQEMFKKGLGVFGAFALGFGLKRFFDLNNTYFFIMFVVIYTIVYFAMIFVFSLNINEQKTVLKKIFRRST